VSVDINLDDLRLGSPKKEELAEIFRKLEFKSLIDKFSEHAELSKKDYRLILTKEELQSLINTIKRKVYSALIQKRQVRTIWKQN